MAGVLSAALAAGAALTAPSTAAQGADPAAAAGLHRFNVPAGPLDQALSRFGRQAQVLISVNAALTEHLDSPGLNGSYTVMEGLALLLAGTGLEAVAEPDGSYSLRKAPAPKPASGASAAMTLSAVTVTGRTVPAGPPGDGRDAYVATRSTVGTKTDTPIIELPQSVSVVTQQQLELQSVQSVSESLRYVSGVLAEQYGGDSRSDNYLVRGFADSFPYLDGLSTLNYFTVLSPVIEPYGLDRVEVLRGPSAVLNGQTGSPGGLVNLVTKRPTAEPLHQLGLETGSYGRIQASFDLGGPLDADGRLLFRLTGLGRDTGTQVDFVHDRRLYFAPALSWRADADTTLILLAHISYRNGGNPPSFLPTVGTLQPNPHGRVSPDFFDGDPGFDVFRRTEMAFGYSVEHRFGENLTLRQNARYLRAILDQKQVQGFGLENDLRTLDRVAFGGQAGIGTAGVDNQAELHFATGPLRHTMLYGLDYLHSLDDYSEQDDFNVPSIDIFAPVYGISVSLPPVDYSVSHTISQIGLYGQDQIRYGRWAGTFSGRRDWASTRTVDRIYSLNTDVGSQAWTWHAGLVYLFDNGLAPYASAATSFTPAIGTAYDGSPLAPTTGDSAEIGLKWQPADGRSLLTLSLYSLVERNAPHNDPQHPFFEQEAGKERVRGVELSDIADLGRGLHLNSAITCMEGKLLQNDAGTNGNQAPNVPHLMLSSWLDKTFQQGPLRGFGFSGGVRYVGPQYGDPYNTQFLPGGALVDAGLHYGRGHWYFAADAKNLLDKIYVGSCAGQDQCNYGPRRMLLFRAGYGW